MQRSTRRNDRLSVALLGAAAVHALLLAALIASRPALRLPSVALAPDVRMELDHTRSNLLSSGRIAAPRLASVDRSRERLAAGVKPQPPEEASQEGPPPSPSAPPAAVPASAPATNGGAIDDAWRIRPHAGPRALGADCSTRSASATSAELAACDKAVAQARAAELPFVDAIPAGKRGYYDAVVGKKEYDRAGAFADMAKMQQARGLAGERTHFDLTVGYHCTFKFGPGGAAANEAAGKKIGFPPCPLHAPGAEPPPP